MKKKSHKTLAIAAGKGGVGKSTLTVHLGLALKTSGMAVGILDADLYGPSIPTMLTEQRSPSQNERGFLPALASGLEVLSLGHFRDKGEAAALRAPMANALLRQLFERGEWTSDVLLVDFPPGTGDIGITLCQTLPFDGALLVTTPSELALQDVRKAAHLFQKMRVPILGVVENMGAFVLPDGSVSYPLGKGGGEKLSKELDVPFLGSIPLDERFSVAHDRGEASSVQLPVFDVIARSTLEALKESRLEPAIELIDPQTLSICFDSAIHFKVSAQALQSRCPCAACQGEKKAEASVSISRHSAVGRYAHRFQFSSGCSSGVYPYALIKEMCQ